MFLGYIGRFHFLHQQCREKFTHTDLLVYSLSFSCDSSCVPQQNSALCPSGIPSFRLVRHSSCLCYWPYLFLNYIKMKRIITFMFDASSRSSLSFCIHPRRQSKNTASFQRGFPSATASLNWLCRSLLSRAPRWLTYPLNLSSLSHPTADAATPQRPKFLTMFGPCGKILSIFSEGICWWGIRYPTTRRKLEYDSISQKHSLLSIVYWQWTRPYCC